MNKPVLNYTNQDYTAILNELINAVQNGTTGLTSRWNNMSQADPLFILMHLFAAHKDMENFMIDYRLNESFMSTARERASMVRIANSAGYKIPSYRTASALYTISEITVNDNPFVGTYIIPDWATFIDQTTGKSYVFIAEASGPMASWGGEYGTDNLQHRLYEGIKQTHSFDISTIEQETRTHIISNQAIAIGSTVSTTRVVSKLTRGETVFTEVPNLLEYTGPALEVYELNVDPQGITYIKFHQNLDLSASTGTFVLTYLITAGSLAVMPSTAVTTEATDDTLPTPQALTVTVEIVPDSQIDGADPATESDIKSGYARFISNAETLLMLEDVYNYIVNMQNIETSFSKVTVYSQDYQIIDGIRYAIQSNRQFSFGANPLVIHFVLTDASNTLVSTSNAGLLQMDILSKVLLPYDVQLNATMPIFIGGPYESAGPHDIEVKVTPVGTITMTPDLAAAIRTAITSYVLSLNLAAPVTEANLRTAFITAGLPVQITSANILFRRKDDEADAGSNLYYPYPNQVLDIASAAADIYIIGDNGDWTVTPII